MISMFCVGDYVRIKNVGRRYSAYDSFFKKQCPELLDEFMVNYDGLNGNNPRNGECGMIVHIGKHGDGSRNLMVIRVDNREGVFLFDSFNNALELIEEDASFEIPVIEQDDFMALIFT